MTSASHEDPDREHGRGAALRDILAGAALIGVGLVTGGSTLDGDFDGVDVFFDVLGGAWIAWGLVRLVLIRRARSRSAR